LAGGAVTGGAFKLGGLKALDDFLLNKKITEFNTYVGLSAGSVLAAPLAAGISPAEMGKSLEGKSEHFSRFPAADFYSPNFSDFATRPAQFALDMLAYLPGTLSDLLSQAPEITRTLQAPLMNTLRNPSIESARKVFTVLGEALSQRRHFPSPLDYL